ncbi:hypothetical protein FAVG1_10457 [Fusarium avenaceum]|nr:hypothetical protein FAVG1_10457 [Fusarium avenaceum]
MNGTQSPDPQKASNTNTNGSNSNNSSLAAKKRKKDLKPIITMEGAKEPAGSSCVPIFVDCSWPHNTTSYAAADWKHDPTFLCLLIGGIRWRFQAKINPHSFQISKGFSATFGAVSHHPTQNSEGEAD